MQPSLFIKRLYNNSYFETGRSPRKRSLLSVNEHSEGKPDAKRVLLNNFYFISQTPPLPKTPLTHVSSVLARKPKSIIL